MKITGCVNGLLDNNGRWNTCSYFCQISVKSWKFTYSRFHRLTSHYNKLIQTLKYCRCNNKLRILKIWPTHYIKSIKTAKKAIKGFSVYRCTCVCISFQELSAIGSNIPVLLDEIFSESYLDWVQKCSSRKKIFGTQEDYKRFLGKQT